MDICLYALHARRLVSTGDKSDVSNFKIHKRVRDTASPEFGLHVRVQNEDKYIWLHRNGCMRDYVANLMKKCEVA